MAGDEGDPDAKVISHLISNGSDPSKPHELDFFFYLPDRPSCESLAARLNASGFRTDVLEPDADSRWAIQAWIWLPLDYGRIRSLTRDFEQIATALGGEFDGWGAEVIE